MLLAELYSAENTCCILRIRLNARKLIHLKIGQQLFNLVIKTDFLDASAAVCHEDSFSERAQHIGKIHNGVFAEDELSRGTINKIFHYSTHLS